MTNGSTVWRDRLANVPVPEQHAMALLAAAAAERLHRARPPGPAAVWHAPGVALLGSGAGLAAWAWCEARDVRLAAPDRLVTTGPYAFSRNPMYLAWSLGHLGAALLSRSGWALAAWVPAVVAVGRDVDAEERELRRRFGATHDRYVAAVPRWIAPSRLKPWRPPG